MDSSRVKVVLELLLCIGLLQIPTQSRAIHHQHHQQHHQYHHHHQQQQPANHQHAFHRDSQLEPNFLGWQLAQSSSSFSALQDLLKAAEAQQLASSGLVAPQQQVAYELANTYSSSAQAARDTPVSLNQHSLKQQLQLQQQQQSDAALLLAKSLAAANSDHFATAATTLSGESNGQLSTAATTSANSIKGGSYYYRDSASRDDANDKILWNESKSDSLLRQADPLPALDSNLLGAVESELSESAAQLTGDAEEELAYSTSAAAVAAANARPLGAHLGHHSDLKHAKSHLAINKTRLKAQLRRLISAWHMATLVESARQKRKTVIAPLLQKIWEKLCKLQPQPTA